jgi:medium-chain acyl-[acyl-carrier-protein] hydrolase
MRWRGLLPTDTHLLVAALPGRELRLLERPVRSMAVVVRFLANAVLPLLDRPLFLFGHSLGALVCYELAHELAARGREPAHLFASAHCAPSLVSTLPRHLHELDDEHLADELVRIGGMPAELSADRDLLAVFLPAIRGDLAIGAAYERAARRSLRCPITALGGHADVDVPTSVLRAWEEETEGPFDLRLFAGGHFYLRDLEAEVVGFVRACIESARQCSSRP